MKTLKSIGSILLGIAVFILIFFVIAFLIKGGVTWAAKLYPILIRATTISTIICLFFFIPLSFIRKTRIVAVYGYLIASYIFGLTLWVFGFLITYSFWGSAGVIIGIFIAGVGVVPFGFIAALLNGGWGLAGNLVYGTILMFGARFLAFWLADKIDKANQGNYINNIEGIYCTACGYANISTANFCKSCGVNL